MIYIHTSFVVVCCCDICCCDIFVVVVVVYRRRWGGRGGGDSEETQSQVPNEETDHVQVQDILSRLHLASATTIGSIQPVAMNND